MQAFCSRIQENGGRVLAVYETNDEPEKAYRAMAQLLVEPKLLLRSCRRELTITPENGKIPVSFL